MSLFVGAGGCKSPPEYRQEAEEVAYGIIHSKQQQALGHTEPFTLERPSEDFRRKLLEAQLLPVGGQWSLGTEAIDEIPFWPESEYPPLAEIGSIVDLVDGEEVQLSLIEALQIGAANSFAYQTQKEQVFRTALALDLERNEFRSFWGQEFQSAFQNDNSGPGSVSGTRQSSVTSWNKLFQNGLSVSAGIVADLVNLLSPTKATSDGLRADASITLPLLRGAGEHIVTEPLTQAERDVVYALWDFERFKRNFAVNVASEYYAVLRALDQIDNEEGNYKRLILSVRRARRLADAGQLDAVQMDQAVQDELRARNRWIQAMQSYERALDNFKNLLGLPTDAQIKLRREELTMLVDNAAAIIDLGLARADPNAIESVPADAPIILTEPNYEGAGPYELQPRQAVEIALEHRLDLQVAAGQIFDAQRAVVVAADRLKPELTLFGSASAGAARSIGGALADDARLEFDQAAFDALLTLDLPLERTAERNLYRNSLIALEQAVRNAQSLEDQVKLDIRNRLRTLLSTRESLQIQALAMQVAQRRVRMTDLLLEAGRAQMRDILEAQEALVSAQNALTAAVVDYRVTELELQRDMGLLQVDETGLWEEFDPEVYIQ